MQLTRSIIAAILVVASLATPLRAEDEKAAIEAFKKQMADLKTHMEEQKAAAKNNPLGGILAMRSAGAKLKAMKTEGLPADFKEAFGDFLKTMEKIVDVMKDFPEKVDEVEAYVKKKSEEDPMFMVKIGEKMQPLFAEGDPKIKKLEEVGKKYGLDKVFGD